MEDLKQKIKRLRKEKRISQTELAEIAGISRISYTYFENGTTDKLSLDAAKGIAKALNVSFNDLFEIEGNSSDIKKLEIEVNQLSKKLEELTEHNKLVQNIYDSSFEISSIGSLELEKLKDIFTLIDLFQFVDVNKFSEDFPYLIKPVSLKPFISLDVIINFYNLYKENSKANLVEYLNFSALEKSPDLLKLSGFGLNAKVWDKKKIIEDLKDIKEFF